MESGVHIMDLISPYECLETFLDSMTDDKCAYEFLTGAQIPLSEYTHNLTEDDVLRDLLMPASYDHIVQQMLQAIFSTLARLFQRMFSDQSVTAEREADRAAERQVMKTVRSTNTVSERDFTRLDNFLRQKPSASLEGLILFTNNKTLNWLETLDADAREHVIQIARGSAHQHRKKFRECLQSIQKEREKILIRKQKQKEETSDSSLKNSWAAYGPGNSNHLEIILTALKDP